MKGTYILVIHLLEDINIKIGSLGDLTFKRGYYFYIGSAMGEKGSSTLLNRVKRHVIPSKEKKIHWHIDYLLSNDSASIECVYLIPSNQRLECTIAQEYYNVCDTYIKNFGSSDCKCKSHLMYFQSFSELKNIFQ